MFVRKSGNLKGFGRPNFADKRVGPKPEGRHIRQYADDGVGHSVQSNAASNHIGISAEAFLPETFCDQCDIGAFFLLRKKIPSADRPNAQHLEIVWRNSPAEN